MVPSNSANTFNRLSAPKTADDFVGPVGTSKPPNKARKPIVPITPNAALSFSLIDRPDS